MREEFRLSMQKVFFNSSIGAWFDYNLQTKAHNTEFYPSVAVPLFAGCYQPLNLAKSQRIYEYMKKVGVFKYPGGVPTSLILNSGQQWDFPNGWSPLNHMVIEGLRKSDSAQMQDQAFQIAKKWIHGNYKVYLETGHMWEKYDVIGKSPKPGAGGEYDVQSGFGWTNGVILDLLVSYNTRIQAPNSFANSRISSASTIFFILLSAFRLF
ncbi:hypothetical protein AB6A40_000211 [Gnathostoma spinigerum]|uniref:Trehalase n=1 Tax=Gnathostoma spinigerum TaxID=75299 RepID=A0ABD6E9Z6_9BILA